MANLEVQYVKHNIFSGGIYSVWTALHWHPCMLSIKNLNWENGTVFITLRQPRKQIIEIILTVRDSESLPLKEWFSFHIRNKRQLYFPRSKTKTQLFLGDLTKITVWMSHAQWVLPIKKGTSRISNKKPGMISTVIGEKRKWRKWEES